MAATRTATETIALGSYTKAVTKASADQAAVIDQCVVIANERHLAIVVKRDFMGRWQGWSKKRNPHGASEEFGYVIEPAGGRRARRIDVKGQPRVYLADTQAPSGKVEAQVIL